MRIFLPAWRRRGALLDALHDRFALREHGIGALAIRRGHGIQIRGQQVQGAFGLIDSRCR